MGEGARGWGRRGNKRREGGRADGVRVQGDGGEGGNNLGTEEGRERARGGREEAVMLGRQRASVEEGRVEGGREGGLMNGTSEEGTGRGMDGGREEASGGGIERGTVGARGGDFKGGILRKALASIQYIHNPSDNAALVIDTLLLQMKNSEQVYIINSVYCLSGG